MKFFAYELTLIGKTQLMGLKILMTEWYADYVGMLLTECLAIQLLMILDGEEWMDHTIELLDKKL